MTASLGKLGVELYADHYGLVKGVQQAEHALEQFERKTIATTKALTAYQNAAAKAGQAMAHSFKSGDVAGHARKVTGALGVYSEKADAAAGASGRFGGALATAGIALFALHKGLQLLRAGFSAVEDAARAQDAALFFERAGKSIAEYRTATHGLISDADLMKKSNLADSMGINEKTFKQLAQVAHAASVKTGQSFEYMFNSIIVGTARSSRLLLDNLGIIVSVKEANLNYAKALKAQDQAGQYADKTAEQLARSLTDVQKKAAFADEVMRKSAGTLDEYTKAGQTASEKFDQFKASVDNLKTAFAGLFVEGMSTYLEKITAVTDGLTVMISRLKHVAVLSILPQVAADTAMDVGTDPFGKGLSPLQSLMTNLYDALESEVSKKQNAQIAANKYLESQQIKAGDALAMSAADIEHFGDLYGAEIANQIRLFKALAHELGTDSLYFANKKPVGNPDAEGSGADTNPKGGKGAKEFKLSTGGGFDEKVLAGAMDFIDKLLGDAIKEEIEIRRFWAKFRQEKENKLMEDEFKLKEFEIELQKKRQQEMLDNVATGISLGGSAATGDISGFFSQLGTIIGTAVGGAGIGSAIGAIVGPLLEPLTTIGDLFEHLVNGTSSLIDLGLKPLLDTLLPLGPALEMLLAAVGQLIGSALAPLLPVVSLIIQGLAGLVSLIAAGIVIISPFIEMFAALATVLPIVSQLFFTLIDAFTGFDLSFFDTMQAGAYYVEIFVNKLAQGAVDISNAIVNFVRGIGYQLETLTGDDFGLSDFGTILELGDILSQGEAATEDNSDATRDNTRAVRDLTREFRNLPQGYKVNYAIYESTAAVGRPAGSIGLAPGVPDSVRDNFRWRT